MDSAHIRIWGRLVQPVDGLPLSALIDKDKWVSSSIYFQGIANRLNLI